MHPCACLHPFGRLLHLPPRELEDENSLIGARLLVYWPKELCWCDMRAQRVCMRARVSVCYN
jgi:hypothetical protein